MNKKICYICHGTMLEIIDYWTASTYWQCLGCGNIEKSEDTRKN